MSWNTIPMLLVSFVASVAALQAAVLILSCLDMCLDAIQAEKKEENTHE